MEKGKEIKKPKSFRFDSSDVKKLDTLHEHYKNEFMENLPVQMRDLYKWSEAQTIALLVRERYEELLADGKIKEIED